VTITKALTIDGGGGQAASVLASGTNGIVVQAGTGNVTLRNLTINGGGTGLSGITFNSGAALIVENCVVFGFASNGVAVSTSTGTSHVAILNSRLSNNSQGGLQVKITGGATTISMTDVKATNNNFGIGVDTTGGGTASLMLDHATINENTTGNQALGANTTVLQRKETASIRGRSKRALARYFGRDAAMRSPRRWLVVTLRSGTSPSGAKRTAAVLLHGTKDAWF
jgi:hypothetical protein